MNTDDLLKHLPNKRKSIYDLGLFLKTRSEGQPNFSMLLGAGASVTSGVRSGKELVGIWRQELFEFYTQGGEDYSPEIAKEWFSKNHNEWYDSDKEYSSFFERKFDLPAQRRIFIEQEVKDSKPSLGYAYLTQLVNENYINTVFTTNFDDLINEAFYLFGSQRPLVCAHDSSIKDVLVTARRPKIIKLHGDYLFDDIKCTKLQTQELDSNTQEKFEQFLREYGLIMLGYSGEDKSIMSPLNTMLDDGRFLRNGLYWCIRKGSDISDDLLEVLKKEKAFYVIVDGFDECMAELHSILLDSYLKVDGLGQLPRLPDTVNFWLESSSKYDSNNKVIQKQLSTLKQSRSRGMLGDALAELYSEDTARNERLKELDDEETIQLMKVMSLRKQYKYEDFIKSAYEHIENSRKDEFKKHLLGMTFGTNMALGDIDAARKDCVALSNIDSDDPSYNLMRADAEDNFNAKIEEIERAIEKAPYFWSPYYKKARAISEALDAGAIERTEKVSQEVCDSFERSIDLKPGVGNPSWGRLVSFLLDSARGTDSERWTSKAADLIKQMQKQGKYKEIVVQQVCKLCYRNKSLDLDAIDENLFSYIESAINARPSYNPKLFEHVVRASIEFDNHDFANNMQNKYEKYGKNLLADPDYSLAVAEMYLEIYQDLTEARRVLDDAMKSSEDTRLAASSIEYALYTDDAIAAREIYDKHEHLFDFDFKVSMDVDIKAHSGQYDEAIRALEALKSQPYFYEKHATTLTFIHLLKEDYAKTRSIAEKVLDKYMWSRENYPTLIINYEYANIKLGKKPNKRRLSELTSERHTPGVRAMSYVLLDDHDRGLSIMLEEAKKRPSKVYQIKNWPVAEPIMARFRREIGVKPDKLEVVTSAS